MDVEKVEYYMYLYLYLSLYINIKHLLSIFPVLFSNFIHVMIVLLFFWHILNT